MIIEGKVVEVGQRYFESKYCLERDTCRDEPFAILDIHKNLKGGALGLLEFFYDDGVGGACGLGVLEVGEVSRFALRKGAGGTYWTGQCTNALGRAQSWKDEEFKSIDEVSQYYIENRAKLLDGIAAAPDSERVWMESGDLLAQFQQYDEAKLSFSRALELNPASTNALAGRGAVFMAQEQYSLALADFERAVLLSPNDAGAIKQRDRAAKCFEKISASDISKRVLIMRKETFCRPRLTD